MDRYCLDYRTGDHLVRLCIALSVFAALACGSRLFSRVISKAGIWWDDILLLLSLVGSKRTEFARVACSQLIH